MQGEHGFLFRLFFGCAGSSLLRGLFLVVVRGGCSSLRWVGFSLWRLLLLQTTSSKGFSSSSFSGCGSWAQEHRLSSCGAWAYLLLGMWNLPGSGIEPSLLHWQADSLPLREALLISF